MLARALHDTRCSRVPYVFGNLGFSFLVIYLGHGVLFSKKLDVPYLSSACLYICKNGHNVWVHLPEEASRSMGEIHVPFVELKVS